MKLALCLEYPVSLRGGVSVVVESLIHGLAGTYSIVLVSPDTPATLQGWPARHLIADHIPWHPVKPRRAAARQLACDLKAAGVGLAHFHFAGNYGWGSRLPGGSPIPYVRRAGIPVISTVHSVAGLLKDYCGDQKPLWFKLAALPVAWLGKIQVVRNAHCEIAASRHDLELLKRWYWPARSRFIQVFHSRIGGDGPHGPAPAREPLILNVGHLAERKGQWVLARAFAAIAPAHPGWKLVFAGPDLENKVIPKINELADRSGLAGRMVALGERNDVQDWMRRAVIYVQPSLEEALGLALQEAMFAGCACIGSRVGGIPELLTAEADGLLVAPGDVAGLAAALERLMTDAGLRQRLGAAARQTIEDRGMTRAAMIRQHIEIYESAYGERP